MATGMIPIRRVVTGNDERGQSKVVWDGPAPNAQSGSMGSSGHTDLWVWYNSPAPLSGERDDGSLPYDFPGPASGGHLRVVQSAGRPANYDSAQDPRHVPYHEPEPRPSRRIWDRGGANSFSSAMHKTETIDYGILLSGERELILDDYRTMMQPGDIVVQVGAWHQWSAPSGGTQMAFDMFSAGFVDAPAGLAQGNDAVVTANDLKLPEGVKPARRIVTIDRERNKGSLVSDGPAPDVRADPARPGYASARLWVTDGTPAKIVFETLHLPHTIEAPAQGSVCRVVTFPPDAGWQGKVGSAEVQSFFQSVGSPGASTYSTAAPHPYMQRTRSLDFCIVLEGEIVLVLDTQEVALTKGDFVIQRGTNHSWSNRSNNPAVLAIASHDGA
ncbi:MAG: cupin domain-containing protein [Dehalococcoidia bacterium]